MAERLKVRLVMGTRLTSRSPGERHDVIHLQRFDRPAVEASPIPVTRRWAREPPHVIDPEPLHTRPATPPGLIAGE